MTTEAEMRSVRRELGNLAEAVQELADVLKDLSDRVDVLRAEETARSIALRNRQFAGRSDI